MAKFTIDYEIQIQISGEATKVENNKFIERDGTTALVRSQSGFDDFFNVGDEIYIPKDYSVYSFQTRNGDKIGIVAKIKSTDGVTEKKCKFFPNCLAKCIVPVDENGRRSPKVRTYGDVATWYAEQRTVDNAMKFLAGKTVVVKEKKYYSVRDLCTHQIVSDYIYRFEWKNKDQLQHSIGINSSQLHKMYIDALHQYNEKLTHIQEKYIESHCAFKVGDIVHVLKRFENNPFYMVINSIKLEGELQDDATYHNPVIRIEGSTVDKDGYYISYWVNHNTQISNVCRLDDVIEKLDIKCKGFK